jgi:hypothetical protein
MHILSTLRFISVLASACLLLGTGFAASVQGAEDRVNIDPNKEKVLVTIGGIDMDIPLGYFYEKTIWVKGKWPKPPTERTLVKEQVVIDVHLDGMKPWTRETAADFKGAALNTSRVVIIANYPAQWFENWLRANPRLRETHPKYVLSGLKAFRVDDRREVFYLTNANALKTRFWINCDDRSTQVRCGVKFAYSAQLVVEYLIPVRDLERWETINSGIIKLLDSFQTKKGD